MQEVTEITTNLKALAKELNVPIMALSQLSRQVENRDDKRPQLSDLRESGSIEQDADVVMFVFREEYYLSNKEPRPGTDEHLKWQTEMDAVHGKAEVIIGKQRHGPTGTVNLQFDAAVTRFDNLAPRTVSAADSRIRRLIAAEAVRGAASRTDRGCPTLDGCGRTAITLVMTAHDPSLHPRRAAGPPAERGRRHADHRPARH